MGMKTIFLRGYFQFGMCLWLVCLFGSNNTTAMAQRNPVHMSIEALVAQADGVYLGTVYKESSIDHDKGGNAESSITIDVSETLKGSPRKRLELLTFGNPPDQNYQTWRQKRTRMLWFVRNGSADKGFASPIQYWSCLTVDPEESLTPLPTFAYFSMEFRAIRSPRKVLDIARRYAKSSSGTTLLFSLRYMPDLIHRLFPYNAGGELVVPVGPQLEKVARRMILSPRSFLPLEQEIKGINHDDYLAARANDEGTFRRMGVECLAHFKSDANIDLLKRQLDDPYLERYWDNDQDVYSVRKLAYSALQKWGVSVPEPRIYLPNNTGRE